MTTARVLPAELLLITALYFDSCRDVLSFVLVSQRHSTVICSDLRGKNHKQSRLLAQYVRKMFHLTQYAEGPKGKPFKHKLMPEKTKIEVAYLTPSYSHHGKVKQYILSHPYVQVLIDKGGEGPSITTVHTASTTTTRYDYYIPISRAAEVISYLKEHGGHLLSYFEYSGKKEGKMIQYNYHGYYNQPYSERTCSTTITDYVGGKRRFAWYYDSKGEDYTTLWRRQTFIDDNLFEEEQLMKRGADQSPIVTSRTQYFDVHDDQVYLNQQWAADSGIQTFYHINTGENSFEKREWSGRDGTLIVELKQQNNKEASCLLS